MCIILDKKDIMLQINFENEALAPDPNIIFIKEKTGKLVLKLS